MKFIDIFVISVIWKFTIAVCLHFMERAEQTTETIVIQT